MWSDFESETVAGCYQLGKLVRSEGRYGWFETGFKDQPAIISLIETLNDEDELLGRLHAAEKVHHPNVAAIFETGTAVLQDTPLVYAVMEFTEENLEDVLRVRSLSAEEARQVTESLLNALSAIHKERLVCAELEPSSVLAAGDTIKLRSDRLLDNPAATDIALHAHEAKDVQALGALLYQCLTQKSPKLDGNDPSIQLLPQPFVQMVRRALSGQATTDEIAALLRPPATPVQTVREKTPPLPVEAEVTERKGVPNLPWIVAGVVLLLLIAAFVMRAMLHSSQTPPETAAAAKTAVDAPPAVPRPSAAVKPSAVPHVAQPVKVPPPLVTPQASATPPSSEKNAIWRVVAFTYNHQDQAEHKARTVNDKYPDLKAEVFSPKGDSGPFLVTVGGPMEHDAALQFRDKAVHEGLPGDSYAQNYSH